MSDEPLLLEPHLAERVWGGGRLGEKIGEAWDLSVHENGPSRIANGPLRGKRLSDVDPAVFGGPIELLAKRLDCSAKLSVQVHPRGEKTEAWVVLDADEGAGVYHGFRAAAGRDEIRRAAEEGSLADLLRFVETPAGTCIFVPSGVVHAIGAGLHLFEIQQSADTTYRLFDWGRNRTLHLDEALDHADLAPVGPFPARRGARLVTCDHFFVDRVAGPRMLDPGARWVALLGVAGRGRLGNLEVAPGTTVLIPTGAGNRLFEPDGADCRIMVYGPPAVPAAT